MSLARFWSNFFLVSHSLRSRAMCYRSCVWVCLTAGLPPSRVSLPPCAGSSGGHDEHALVLGQRRRHRRLVPLRLQRLRHRRAAHLRPAPPAHVSLSHPSAPWPAAGHTAMGGRGGGGLGVSLISTKSWSSDFSSVLRPEISSFDGIVSFFAATM